jgi:MOSC domain-containing protein YiiM
LTRFVRVVSVNVGRPRSTVWKGEPVTTAIFKKPVTGPVRVEGVNLEGDRQADLSVHGGRDKAVYAYAAEHYPYWRETLGRDLPWGMFGENLTVEGVPLEDELAVGDTLRVGTAELVVTQPRLPCFKLGLRFGDAGMVRRFLEAGRSGVYLRIQEPGVVEAGDAIELGARHPAGLPVSEITRLYARDRGDVDGLRRALAVDALIDDWRPYFEQLLQQALRPAAHTRG